MKNFLALALLCYSSLGFALDTKDDEMFGDSIPDHKKEESLLKDTTTTIGGRLSVDTAASLKEGQKASGALYHYGTTLYTYLDAQPNDVTRGFVRLRTLYPNPNFNASVADDESPLFDLDEAWVKLAAWDRHAFITFGRQHVKWGTGRFWNPSDVLAPSPKDPLAIYDYRLGSNLLKIHIPMEKESFNFYAIVDAERLGTYKKPGGALRAEFTGKASEFSVTAYAREKRPTRLAADLSIGLGPVDVRGEFVASTLNRNTFYRGEGSLSNPLAIETYSRKEQWIPQAVMGIKYDFQYSDQSHLTMEAEYFYNGLGYKNRDLETLSLLSRDSAPLYAGRDYLGILFALPSPGSWQDTTLVLSSLNNLSDQSGLIRLSTQIRFYKEVLLELWASGSYGKRGEFRFEIPEGALPATPQTNQDTIVSGTPVAATVSRAVGASMSLLF